jgi:hypothetical protein
MKGNEYVGSINVQYLSRKERYFNSKERKERRGKRILMDGHELENNCSRKKRHGYLHKILRVL